MSGAGIRESLRGWAVDLALATAGGLFLALLGPFGSYLNGPFWQRAIFQMACFLTGTLLFGGGIRLILRLALPRAWTWAAVVVMVAVLSIPFSVAVSHLARLIWPFLTRLTPLDWYLQGLVTAEPVVLALAWVNLRRAHQRALRTEAKGAAAPTMQGELGVPPAEVLCLQMEDHYVRVHTATGSRLMLMPLSQAIAALNGAPGLQVHRSWWVAAKAVAAAETQGRNLRLRLTNGVVAPVARSAVPTVRAAGWLGP